VRPDITIGPQSAGQPDCYSCNTLFSSSDVTSLKFRLKHETTPIAPALTLPMREAVVKQTPSNGSTVTTPSRNLTNCQIESDRNPSLVTIQLREQRLSLAIFPKFEIAAIILLCQMGGDNR
jgi:hypothetical protein